MLQSESLGNETILYLCVIILHSIVLQLQSSIHGKRVQKQKMRPRINRKEAEIIRDSLLVTRRMLLEKQERIAELQKVIPEMRRRLWTEGYQVIKEGYTKKKEELQTLERNSFDIHTFLRLYDKLIQKYQAIAEGKHHRGGYKHLSLTCGYTLEPERKLEEVITENVRSRVQT